MSVLKVNTYEKIVRLTLLLASLGLSSCASNLVIGNEPEPLQFEVVQQFPHSTDHFTQGLFFHESSLYESTGQYGQSQLIRYDMSTVTPMMARSVAAKYFGEGATVHQGTIFQLTWRAGTALAYDPRRLSKKEGFEYAGQGWGLTSDGEYLWMSNGSHFLQSLNVNGDVLSSVEVTFNGNPLNQLNELEWIDGKIFANRWYDNRIFVIDPETGEVTAYFSLVDLAEPELKRGSENVLNGIAWNPETETLWITGKNWQNLYELKLPDMH